MPGKLPERWLPLAEFQAWDWTPPETVIAPWLPVGGLALLYGAGGVGKTYLSLAYAMSIAEGRSRVPRCRAAYGGNRCNAALCSGEREE